MRFYKISSPVPVVEHMAKRLREELGVGKKVFWLVSGGSAIEVAVEVSKKLTGLRLDLLTVSLTDERYGAVGHPDSNWQKLLDAGFSIPGANLKPVLFGKEMTTTVTDFAETLITGFGECDTSIGLFGIGADGHTAGILPGSPAVNDTNLACGYDAGEFKRITVTPSLIKLFDEAVVYAVGDTKWPVIDRLDGEHSISDLPAQALKQVSNLTIFNDRKGEII